MQQWIKARLLTVCWYKTERERAASSRVDFQNKWRFWGLPSISDPFGSGSVDHIFGARSRLVYLGCEPLDAQPHPYINGRPRFRYNSFMSSMGVIHHTYSKSQLINIKQSFLTFRDRPFLLHVKPEACEPRQLEWRTMRAPQVGSLIWETSLECAHISDPSKKKELLRQRPESHREIHWYHDILTELFLIIKHSLQIIRKRNR